jgi:hypothetical protein
MIDLKAQWGSRMINNDVKNIGSFAGKVYAEGVLEGWVAPGRISTKVLLRTSWQFGIIVLIALHLN